jgi:hypothetical protein
MFGYNKTMVTGKLVMHSQLSIRSRGSDTSEIVYDMQTFKLSYFLVVVFCSKTIQISADEFDCIVLVIILRQLMLQGAVYKSDLFLLPTALKSMRFATKSQNRIQRRKHLYGGYNSEF